MSLAGSLLVAHSSLSDPNFNQTVVLILAHSEGGAFGLVVNRPIKKKGLPFQVFHGGPCSAPGLFMLHGHPDWIDEAPPSEPDDDNEAEPSQREVAPGIFLGDAGCIQRASEPADGEKVRCRAFQGYAGWGPGQLERELESGSWLVTPADSNILFETPIEKMWTLLAPPRIPRPSLN